MGGGVLGRRWALAVAVLVTLGCAGAANGTATDAFDKSQLEVRSSTFAGFSDVAVAVELGDLKSGVVPVAARVDVTIPAGYGLTIPGQTGAKIGDFLAIGVPTNNPDDGGLLIGSVLAEDPATYAADPVAQACAPGLHTAYWAATLDSVVPGSGVPLPIAVDAVQAEGGATSYSLHFCPFVSPSAAFPSGLSLVASFLTFRQATVPSATGTYQWSAVVTPATATFTPDPASAFELRADVLIPQVLTLHARYNPKAHAAVLSGRLVALGTPRAGVTVSVARAADVDHPKATKTRSDGSFVLQEPIARSEEYEASVDTQSIGCTAPSPAPGGCRGESITGATSLAAVLVVRRATDPKLAPKSGDQAIAARGVLVTSDVPGSASLGDAPPPCEGFTPDLHKLTETGTRRSSLLLTSDRTAEVYATASVFGTTGDAKSDFSAVGQTADASCEVNAVARTLDANVVRLKPMSIRKIGSAARGYRATLNDGVTTFTADVLFVRAGRTVITLHVLSLSPATGLELSLARKLAARAH
jgi:hypothetical protein